MRTIGHVTSTQLQTLMRTIDARERALRERIVRQREAVEVGLAEDALPGDEADQAQERERKTVEGDLLELYLAELAEIGAARERVATGVYGRCLDCGESIDAARLSAQPTARRCVDCQARRERLAGAAST